MSAFGAWVVSAVVRIICYLNERENLINSGNKIG